MLFRSVTPNLPEFALLSQDLLDKSAYELERSMQLFAQQLSISLLVKGGHSKENPVDRLWHQGVMLRFTSPRDPGRDVHGTGGALNALIAVHLTLGKSLEEAFKSAKATLYQWIKHSKPLGSGQRMLFPGIS